MEARPREVRLMNYLIEEQRLMQLLSDPGRNRTKEDSRRRRLARLRKELIPRAYVYAGD